MVFLKTLRMIDLRSAGEISFEEEPGTLAIRIDAEHKRFGLEETETASDVELSLGSMRQLLKNQTEPFYLTPRHVHTLKPRQFDSLNPVKIGEKLAEHVEDAATLVVDAATSIAEAATSMIGSATAAAVSLATSVTGEVLKEFAKLENGAAMSKNFNIAMHHNIKSVPHVYKGEIETAESRIEITKPITKIISGFPTITFVNSHASIDMDFILRFQTSIAKNLEKKLAGVGDKEKRGIADWISEASLTIEALDAVDIRIQAEVVIPAGAVISCSLSVWPIPGLFGCVPLVLGGPLLVASKAPSTPQPPSGEPGDKHSWFVNTMNKNLEKLPSSFTKQSKYDSSKQVSRLSMEYKNVSLTGPSSENPVVY
ncbi:hypothetical protein K504DRAFT_49881 [Pleomassaria siparia CBS 279.74]|uniref:Uncharacterized protein n=1 Tax=Pleomassaria siparia CBS 279.74 TaxID=1314801 RepID=A0A6G1K3J1_9PLEO|nr:hypothetical protein K504DRAFT_49881 [Pleomassaria siparia CBS 279.74]